MIPYLCLSVSVSYLPKSVFLNIFPVFMSYLPFSTLYLSQCLIYLCLSLSVSVSYLHVQCNCLPFYVFSLTLLTFIFIFLILSTFVYIFSNLVRHSPLLLFCCLSINCMSFKLRLPFLHLLSQQIYLSRYLYKLSTFLCIFSITVLYGKL